MKPVNSMIRVAAYYPFFNTFNGMQQFPKQPILYAFDLFAAPMLQADMWKYVRLNFAGGLHYMYQLTDEYHMNYLGGGLLAGVELPFAKRWIIFDRRHDNGRLSEPRYQSSCTAFRFGAAVQCKRRRAVQ